MSSYVLVHGAWHGSWYWYKVVPELRERAHTVKLVELPGHGVDKTPVEKLNLEMYAERVNATVDSLDEPVTLVGHSMGGLAISAAAEKQPEQVEKLVYLTAFLLPENSSIMDMAHDDEESLVPANLEPDEQARVFNINRENADEIFYHDAPESDVVLGKSLIQPEPMVSLTTPLETTNENFGSIPRVYIECTKDRTISPATQKNMYSERPCEKVMSIESSHTPFLSKPAELADILAAV
jgi:pimeloyl-ACP methyl ester carboxylesterase